MSTNGTGAFDLSAFDGLVEAQEAGVDVEILSPDGKPLGPDGFRIRIAGIDSKRFRSIRREFINDDIERQSTADLTPEEQDERQIRTLARCTLSWTTVKLGGEEIACTESNARMLYRRFPFIRDQVEMKAGRRSAFMTRSVAPSAERSETSTTEAESVSQP